MVNSPMESIELKDVTVSFDRHPALHHVTTQLPRGGLIAVTGPNGAGKSTLLKVLAGMVRPGSGRVIGLRQLRQRLVWLPQQAELQSDFPISVIETVCLGHWRRVSWFRAMTAELVAQGSAALARVGLAGFESRSLASLSAGQLQRVLFARIIVADAEVILLDEPFAALDHSSSDSLMTLVQEWHREGRTVIAVLHDREQIMDYFPYCLLLARQLIAAGPTAKVLTVKNLKSANQMMEAWDDSSPLCALPLEVNL
ncbi:MAG: metal ABC transporter ATP-binding protein [Candidatus Pacebacteria bacterium]|nr:metal ABC transporter ATP-binding protein [Candidatus Paceibacterota bacterium]